MIKRFKNFTFLLLFAMVCSLIPCSSVLAAETPSVFTYREQTGTVDIDGLTLAVGDTYDLRFIGVKDWKNYSIRWNSTNPDVASVNKAGVITAKSEGYTEVYLIVGDGSKYISSPVIVSVVEKPVKEENKNYIGTSEADVFVTKAVAVGQSLKFGVYDENGKAISMDNIVIASSTIEVGVVSVSNEFKALKSGSTEITAYSEYGEIARAIIYVYDNASTSPTIIPTVEPTKTPTIEPTKVPTSTPAPTVAPNEKLEFTAEVIDEKNVKLTFNKGVALKDTDIEVFQNKEAVNIAGYTHNGSATDYVLTFANALKNNSTFSVVCTGAEKSVNFKTAFKAPDDITLSYKSLGDKEKAYASSDDVYSYAPATELVVKLTYQGMDVTDTFIEDGSLDFDIEGNYSVDYKDGNLYFSDEDEVVTVVAKWTPYKSSKDNQTLESIPVVIVSEECKPYEVTKIVEWTTVTNAVFDNINWGSVNHNIISCEEYPYRIICLIEDSYGFRYSTDERGVDELNGIYSLSDSSTPLGSVISNVTFENDYNSALYVTDEGDITAYERGTAKVDVCINYGYENDVIGTLSITAKAPRQINKIKTSTNKISLTSDVISHSDELCTAKFFVLAYDQYGNIWDKDLNLIVEETSGIDVSSAISINGNVITVDGNALSSTASGSTFKLKITHDDSHAQGYVNVLLKKPQYDKDTNEIVVNSWGVPEAFTYDISLNLQDGGLEKSFYYDIYKLSRSTIPVGIYDSQVYATNSNTRYTGSNCAEGDFYVNIKDPNGKNLALLNGSSNRNNGLGYTVEGGRIKVYAGVLDYSNTSAYVGLEEGTYTVTVTYIAKSDGTNVTTRKAVGKFTITNSSKDLTFNGVNSTTYKANVYEDKDSIAQLTKEVVAEVFSFSLDGRPWTTVTEEHIVDVKYTYKNNLLTISSVSVIVPYITAEDYGYPTGYATTIKNINKTIRIIDEVE